MPDRIGITSTLPVEILLAAGLRPVDLNNLFVSDENPSGLVDEAEGLGFPRNCCSWIKGIYTIVRRRGIRRVVGVTGGDCSYTRALLEVLASEGTEVYDFSYPPRPEPEKLDMALRELAHALGADLKEAEAIRDRVRATRELAWEIDRLTFEEDRVSGRENHLWLVSTSDFFGDPDRYHSDAERFISEVGRRPPLEQHIRLGYVGVPPLALELYDFIEKRGARVVYNEIQRQFSMPTDSTSLREQYARYTYPYSFEQRISDIRREVGRRRIHGLIHYVQSFCFRQIQDRLLREALDLPILTLEYDRPQALDGRLKIRIEAFLELLQARGPKTGAPRDRRQTTVREAPGLPPHPA
jgi:benzoyl-CoA reductase/2-hydroxyglutaryl-CoA dehydratase subunit BcrC/BadD/HgdB